MDDLDLLIPFSLVLWLDKLSRQQAFVQSLVWKEHLEEKEKLKQQKKDLEDKQKAEKEEDENQEEKNIIRLRGSFEDSPQVEENEEVVEDIVEEENNQNKTVKKRAVKNG